MRPGYLDLAGNKISINPITALTIRNAKANGLDWLGNPEQVVSKIFPDVEKLGEAIAFCSGKPLDNILEGLAGDVIEKAQEAFVQAYAEFLPAQLREKFLEIPGDYRKAIAEAMKDAEQSEPPSEGANDGQ